jgi:hypothetical protein
MSDPGAAPTARSNDPSGTLQEPPVLTHSQKRELSYLRLQIHKLETGLHALARALWDAMNLHRSVGVHQALFDKKVTTPDRLILMASEWLKDRHSFQLHSIAGTPQDVVLRTAWLVCRMAHC